MKTNKNKRFTLIAIIAIIVLIAVPVVMDVITKVNKSAFKDLVYRIVKSGELYYADKLSETNGITSDVTFTFPNNMEGLKLEGSIPSSGSMKIREDGKVAMAISDGKYCAKKGFEDSNVSIDEDLKNCKLPNYKDIVLNGANPELKEGLIPVTIENDGTVKKADIDKEWYNYGSKIWANAVTVTENTRDSYTSAASGTIINEEDILTYLTWIPRYKYKLWYTEAIDGDSTLDTSKVHSIDIVFEDKNKAKSNGSKNGTYLTHPAFTFGKEELNGIWVGKFEAGYSGATSTSEAEKSTADSTKVIIKPNSYSWRKISISNIFETVKGMNKVNTFGLNTTSDTHLMKNTEWGAVAYLSHSKYGKDSEVYINNNKIFMTGCGGNFASATRLLKCLNKFGSKSDGIYNQSTTGNISGIFDMSGGAFEYVMGYTTGADTKYGRSGFTDSTFPEDKYVDKYTSTSMTEYSKRILGDATGEMGPFNSYEETWYGDYADFANSNSPWFLRGGDYIGTSDTGVFLFASYDGASDNDSSFRVVLS